MGETSEGKKVDEAWKARAKGESGAEDVEGPPKAEGGRPATGPAEGESSDERGSRPPLPEPSLKTFVSGVAGQVLINLGLFVNPATEKREKDLEQAKYSIDLLQILKDKMRGNLTDEEEKLMNTMLYDLRMRYVSTVQP